MNRRVALHASLALLNVSRRVAATKPCETRRKRTPTSCPASIRRRASELVAPFDLLSHARAPARSLAKQIIASRTFRNFDLVRRLGRSSSLARRADNTLALTTHSRRRHTRQAYYDFPFQGIAREWQAMGGELYELIEPVDGFHPGQLANYLMPDWSVSGRARASFVASCASLSPRLWRHLSAEHPSFLGAPNPNNARIAQLFGDQGGYY